MSRQKLKVIPGGRAANVPTPTNAPDVCRQCQAELPHNMDWARSILKEPLRFGDATQICAVRQVEKWERFMWTTEAPGPREAAIARERQEASAEARV